MPPLCGQPKGHRLPGPSHTRHGREGGVGRRLTSPDTHEVRNHSNGRGCERRCGFCRAGLSAGYSSVRPASPVEGISKAKPPGGPRLRVSHMWVRYPRAVACCRITAESFVHVRVVPMLDLQNGSLRLSPFLVLDDDFSTRVHRRRSVRRLGMHAVVVVIDASR